MEYWCGQVVNGTSEDYGLMEDLLQIREADEDEESLYYSRFVLDQDEEDYEDDSDEFDELEEEDEDYDVEDDLDDEEDIEDEIEFEEEEEEK